MSTATVSIPLTFTQLTPLSTWQAYCALRLTTGGRESSYADMLSSSTTLKTTCCKSVAFLTAPTTLLVGDGSVSSTTTTSMSVFTYTLESAPNVAPVVITPLFFWANGSVVARSLGVTAIPPTATFTTTASSSQLTGKFYVNVATQTLSASITIRLGVSGTSSSSSGKTLYPVSIMHVTSYMSYLLFSHPALLRLVLIIIIPFLSSPSLSVGEYAGGVTIVTIVGSGQPLPAPKLLRCVHILSITLSYSLLIRHIAPFAILIIQKHTSFAPTLIHLLFNLSFANMVATSPLTLPTLPLLRTPPLSHLSRTPPFLPLSPHPLSLIHPLIPPFSCSFANTGGYFTAVFDRPTDEAGLSQTTPWLCSSLFSFVGDGYSQCIWVDAATVQGSFGAVVPSKVVTTITTTTTTSKTITEPPIPSPP